MQLSGANPVNPGVDALIPRGKAKRLKMTFYRLLGKAEEELRSSFGGQSYSHVPVERQGPFGLGDAFLGAIGAALDEAHPQMRVSPVRRQKQHSRQRSLGRRENLRPVRSLITEQFGNVGSSAAAQRTYVVGVNRQRAGKEGARLLKGRGIRPSNEPGRSLKTKVECIGIG